MKKYACWIDNFEKYDDQRLSNPMAEVVAETEADAAIQFCLSRNPKDEFDHTVVLRTEAGQYRRVFVRLEHHGLEKVTLKQLRAGLDT